MADYTGTFVDIETFSGVADTKVGALVEVETLEGFSYADATATPDIIQRIWDTGVGWCQYTQETFNPTPASGDTEPNHTNNLVAGTHQKLGEF